MQIDCFVCMVADCGLFPWFWVVGLLVFLPCGCGAGCYCFSTMLVLQVVVWGMLVWIGLREQSNWIGPMAGIVQVSCLRSHDVLSQLHTIFNSTY